MKEMCKLYECECHICNDYCLDVGEKKSEEKCRMPEEKEELKE